MQFDRITISGFKSIVEEQTICFGQLTIFAGANSGGKSSASQALLLLKQTLDSQYDPGTLLIYGTNVKFTSSDQIFSKGSNLPTRKSFYLGMYNADNGIRVRYDLSETGSIRARSVEVSGGKGEFAYTESSRFSFDDLAEKIDQSIFPSFVENYRNDKDFKLSWRASADRCFPDLRLILELASEGDERTFHTIATHPAVDGFRRHIGRLVHISGLRGNPERSYLATAKPKSTYPGAFEDYVAAILLSWQRTNAGKISQLSSDLRELGLTWKLQTAPLQQAHAEIRIGRLESAVQGGAHDLVSLADVGLGVSQVLPFLVALHALKPGQMVFIEQPEIHLHPRAQMKLARVIAAALARGVVVWMETHSSILLRAVQTLIAKGEISSSVVRMNWFQRTQDTGTTFVTTSEPDRFGRLGQWPADFDSVTMEVDRDYLNAVAEARARGDD